MGKVTSLEITPFGFLSKTRALVAKSDSCNQLATNTAIHLIRTDGGIEWEEKDLGCE